MTKKRNPNRTTFDFGTWVKIPPKVLRMLDELVEDWNTYHMMSKNGRRRSRVAKWTRASVVIQLIGASWYDGIGTNPEKDSDFAPTT